MITTDRMYTNGCPIQTDAAIDIAITDQSKATAEILLTELTLESSFRLLANACCNWRLYD